MVTLINIEPITIKLELEFNGIKADSDIILDKDSDKELIAYIKEKGYKIGDLIK